MKLSNPLLMIGGKPRLVVYLVLAVFAIVVGALNEFYGDNDPEWVEGLMRVAVWAAPLLGLTAATHVPAAPDVRAVAVDPPARVTVVDDAGGARHTDLDGDGVADGYTPGGDGQQA